MLSDEATARCVGFRDVDADFRFYCRTSHIKDSTEWGGYLTESVDQILMSMDLPRATLRRRYICKPEHRQALAARFSGRGLSPEETAELVGPLK